MKSIYRFVAVIFPLFFCGISSFAQEVLWNEDFSGVAQGSLPVNEELSYVFVNGGPEGTEVTKVMTANLAKGKQSPELLIAKKYSNVSGSFSATIPLKGNKRVYLSFVSNKDASYLGVSAPSGINISKVKDGDVNGSAFVYQIDIADDISDIMLTFTSLKSDAVRVDDIKLYTKNVILWEVEANLGSQNALPKLSDVDELPIVYSSSDENIATINSNGEIELLTTGETIINAKFAGNDEFEAFDASYKLIVKPMLNLPTNTIGLKSVEENAQVYNVAGQRVGAEYKGFAIQNGQKRIQK